MIDPPGFGLDRPLLIQLIEVLERLQAADPAPYRAAQLRVLRAARDDQLDELGDRDAAQVLDTLRNLQRIADSSFGTEEVNAVRRQAAPAAIAAILTLNSPSQDGTRPAAQQSTVKPDPNCGRESGFWPARKPVGLVVIDPIPLFQQALSGLIELAPGIRLLGHTANLHSAVTLCERLRPDVVMIDAVLDPRCHLALMLTTSHESLTVLSVVREPLRHRRYVETALQSGIQGLILRSAEPQQFVAAIRQLRQEGRYLDPGLAVLAGEQSSRLLTQRQPLTRREYQILQMVSDGQENQAIAKSLFVSIETVRTHVKSILRKLHARDRAHAVAVAFRLGVLVAHQQETAESSAYLSPDSVDRRGHAHVTSQPTQAGLAGHPH